MSGGPPRILTLDVGSASVRAGLFDASGRRLALGRQVLAVQTGPNGESEIPPDRIWQALCGAVAQACAGAGGASAVAAISVTAALGVVALDGDNRPLGPVMTWADRRAGRQAVEIGRLAGEAALYQAAGRRSDPELAAAKLLWLRQNAPDLWRRCRRLAGVKDWLVARLSGAWLTDPTSASYTLLYEVATRRWNAALMAELGVAGLDWPMVRPADAVAGPLTPQAADALGLPAGVPVAVGGPDGSMGALGAGLTAPGRIVDVSGTTDVVLAALDRPVLDPQRRLVTNAFVQSGLWTVGGPLGMTGGTLTWLAGLLAAPPDTDPAEAAAGRLDRLLRAAADLAPGADGLLVLPWLTGERTPGWNPQARGAVVGLAPHHRPAHLVRAALEGAAYAVADTVDAVETLAGGRLAVHLAGGAAGDRLLCAVRAAVLDRPIHVAAVAEASSLGAAMAGAVAGGLAPGLSDVAAAWLGAAETIAPDPGWAGRYRRLRPLFGQLTGGLVPVHAGLAAGATGPVAVVSDPAHGRAGRAVPQAC